MTKAQRDFLNALIILAFSALAYYGSLSIPIRNISKTEADFFPKIIITVMALLGVCLLLNSAYKILKEKDYRVSISLKKIWEENKKVILTFLIFGVYVFLLDVLGYFIATPIFLFALYRLLVTAKQKIWIVLVGIIVMTLILFWIFQELLYVFLPSGMFF